MKRIFRSTLFFFLLSAAGGSAVAHDSWFARLGAPGAAEPLLALGTGNLFPVMEFAIGPEFLVRSGCRGADGAARPMSPVRVAKTALVLRPGQPGAATCWAQLKPFDVEVEPDKVELYLAEVNAGPALRATWAAMQSRGAPWKERYTKHARIELQAAPASGNAPEPADMAVDIRRVSGSERGSSPGTTRAGDTLVFELHRSGRPMAAQQVELRHAASTTGVWHETDAQGRVKVQPDSAGEWLLRAIDLRVSTTQPDQWESDFVTLAFSVSP